MRIAGHTLLLSMPHRCSYSSPEHAHRWSFVWEAFAFISRQNGQSGFSSQGLRTCMSLTDVNVSVCDSSSLDQLYSLKKLFVSASINDCLACFCLGFGYYKIKQKCVGDLG